jgi:hypothetical protein
MKIETLKELIERIDVVKSNEALSKNGIQDAVKEEVLNLIQLYIKDNLEPTVAAPFTFSKPFDQWTPIGGSIAYRVPYSTLCSCNPANGGSGICGCVMANKLVEPADFSGPYSSNSKVNYTYSKTPNTDE